MNVDFRYTTGSTRAVNVRFAEILQKLGKGTYQTRDMRAARPPQGDGLESLTVDELRELAEKRGVKVHHKAGAEKIIKALRGK